MTIAELLQYANLLLLPAMGYIIKLESRIGRLEVLLSTLSDSLAGHMSREEIMIDRLTDRRQAERGT